MLTCSHCQGLTPSDTEADAEADAEVEASTTCLHCDAPLARPPRWLLKLTALLGPAGAILLAACYGAPGRYLRDPNPRSDGVTRFDADHDGAYGPWQCVPGNYQCTPDYLATLPPPPNLDCDDQDPQRYPGAPDLDGDGIDQNCDGLDGVGDPRRGYATPPPSASPPATVAVPPEP